MTIGPSFKLHLTYLLVFFLSSSYAQVVKEVNIYVRNGNDHPNRCARSSIKIDHLSRRTGWFGQPEPARLMNDSKIEYRNQDKSKQSFSVLNPTYIHELTLYAQTESDYKFSWDNESYHCPSIIGHASRESDSSPAVGVKVCGYYESTLCDSTIIGNSGYYDLDFPCDTRGPYNLSFILDSRNACPMSFNPTERINDTGIDLTDIEEVETDVRLDVVIDDVGFDLLRDFLNNSRRGYQDRP